VRTTASIVGAVPKTSAPDPVSPVTADARFELDGVARNVATPVPSPETPVEIGNPVAFVSVPLDGVPRAGVTNVGEFAKTAAPVPVSSVKAERRLALDGVASQLATPVPRPLTSVEIGSPVALVKIPLDGVPRAPPLVRIELSTNEDVMVAQVAAPDALRTRTT
jgi:hypothetical protein